MFLIKRLCDIDFPDYAHLPGSTPHPNKLGGHSYKMNMPKISKIDSNNPSSNTYLLYSYDLYNFGYYWESHVWLEEIWNVHNRKGHIADFLKAFIKLCASGVKTRMYQEKNAIDHLVKFFDQIEILSKTHGTICLLNLHEMILKKDQFYNDIKLYCTQSKTEKIVFTESIVLK